MKAMHPASFMGLIEIRGGTHYCRVKFLIARQVFDIGAINDAYRIADTKLNN